MLLIKTLIIFPGKMLSCVQGCLATIRLNSLNTSDTSKIKEGRGYPAPSVNFFQGTVNLWFHIILYLKCFLYCLLEVRSKPLIMLFKDFHNSNINILKSLISVSPADIPKSSHFSILPSLSLHQTFIYLWRNSFVNLYGTPQSKVLIVSTFIILSVS